MGYQRRVHGDCTLSKCSVTMLRPLLLLLPCLLALAWDMDDLHARGHLDRDIPGFDQEFEDMEDELEEDFEEERSLNTDDFDEHADDMGTWRILPLRRWKTAKPSLTTERAVLPGQLFDVEDGQTELWSWTATQRPSLSRPK